MLILFKKQNKPSACNQVSSLMKASEEQETRADHKEEWKHSEPTFCCTSQPVSGCWLKSCSLLLKHWGWGDYQDSVDWLARSTALRKRLRDKEPVEVIPPARGESLGSHPSQWIDSPGSNDLTFLSNLLPSCLVGPAGKQSWRQLNSSLPLSLCGLNKGYRGG